MIAGEVDLYFRTASRTIVLSIQGEPDRLFALTLPSNPPASAEFGPWQTVWKRHHRFSVDGTWDAILAELVAHADAVGELDWTVSVDSTINRAHQHGTTLPRDTGGTVESQEIGARAAGRAA